MQRRSLSQVNERMQHMPNRSKYFYAIGLSYQKADAEVRGHFSLSDSSKQNLLVQAKEAALVHIALSKLHRGADIQQLK